MKCKYCNSYCLKAGHSRTGVQRYRCKLCRKYQQGEYVHNAYKQTINKSIISLLTEGIGIRGIARVLSISATTVISRIELIAQRTTAPSTHSANGIYEIDELWTYVRSKNEEVWITYALERVSKQVVDFVIGPRTKECLSQVTSSTLALSPLKVCTDGLSTYRTLVPGNIHRVGTPHTHRIERFNLNLRTHLKRLSRKTICFSKSITMLESCLKIYFWSAK